MGCSEINHHRGQCIDYCTRKKKERSKVERNLMDDIENAPSNDTLFDQLQILESKLNTILEFETNMARGSYNNNNNNALIMRHLSRQAYSEAQKHET